MSYFGNIVEAATSIWNGMGITLSHLWRRPTTVQYPDRVEVPVRDTLPDRYRGFLEVDMNICTACKACERDCPIDCIKIEASGKGADRVMTQFDIDIAKCMFCGLCTENCPTGAIQHTAEFEAASISMYNLTFRFVPDPVKGVKPYKPEKGAEAFERAPLGSIVHELIKPWDAPDPAFPAEEAEGEAESKGAAGPSELAKQVVAPDVDQEKYAEILEQAMAGTDCGACGYPTCREYSEAIAAGKEENLNLCEPGGVESTEEVKQIVAARLTGQVPPGPIPAERPVVGSVLEALKAMGAAAAEVQVPAAEPESAPAEAKPAEPAAVQEVSFDEFQKMLEEAMAGTDCGACDYPTCHDYAMALAKGEIPSDDIERCEPGGEDTAAELAEIFRKYRIKAG